MSQQSKKQAFACKVKLRRRIARVEKENRHKPGFMGVVTRLKISSKDGDTVQLCLGAVFMGVRYRAST